MDGNYTVWGKVSSGMEYVDMIKRGEPPANPDIIVKAVDRSVLGTGTVSAEAARRVYADLLSRGGWSAVNAVRNKRVLLLSEELLEAPHLRPAAMLMIAKTASPDLFADVSADDALAMLAEEAAGSAPYGTYYYHGQGGF